MVHSQRKAGWEPEESTNERNTEGDACTREEQMHSGPLAVYIFRGKKAPGDIVSEAHREVLQF